MGNFFNGMAMFFGSFAALVKEKALFDWFRRVSVKAFILALLAMMLVIAMGAWGIAQLSHHWLADVGALLWILALLFFSGSLCMLFMSIFVSLFGAEQMLVQALTGEMALELGRPKASDLRKEWGGTLISAFATLLAWPLFIFPLTFPLAFLLLGWAFGREAQYAARRICHQSGHATDIDLRAPDSSFSLGMGLGPALLSMVPLVGWMMWPLLLISALRGQLPGRGL